MATTNLGDAHVNIKVNVEGIPQIAQLRSALTGLTSFGKQLKTAFQTGGEVLREQGQRLRTLSFTVRDAGRQITLFGLAITGAFALITAEGAKFEQGFANVVSVMSEFQTESAATSAEMERLSDFLLNLAADTKFTASEITAAAEQLALAGFTSREIQDSLAGIANLAAAAGQTAETTATAAVSILKAFDIEAKDIQRVADTLTATFTNTNTTLVTLQESFKLVSPTAAAFGISLEEVATAIGILGDTGLRGSLAGTGLSRLFTQLAADVENINELLVPLGSSQEFVDPTKNSISDIIAEFDRLVTSGRLTEAALADAFDQRAVRALLNLIKQGSDRFDELNEKIEQSAGLTDRVAKTRLDTFLGQLEIMRGAFSSLATELFQTFTPTLTSIATGIGNLVDKSAEWVKANEGVVTQLSLTVGGVGLATIAVGLLIGFIGKLIAILASLAITLGTLGIAVTLTFPQFLLILGGIAAALLLIQAIAEKVTRALEFFGIIDSSGKDSAQLLAYTEQVRDLSEAVEEYRKVVQQTVADQRRFNHLISGAGRLSEAQIEKFRELVNKGATASSNQLRDRQLEIRQAIADTNRELNQLRIEAESETAGANSAIKSQFDSQIASLEEDLKSLRKLLSEVGKQAGELSAIERVISTPVTQSRGDILQGLEKQLEAKKLELEIAVDDKSRQQIQDIIQSLNTSIDFLNSFSDESFAIFRRVRHEAAAFGLGMGQAYLEALEAAQKFEAKQRKIDQQNQQIRKSAKEAADKVGDLFHSVDEGLSSSLERELHKLEHLRQDLITATAALANEAVLNADLGRVGELMTDLTIALGKLSEMESRVFEERDRNRDDQIRQLKRDRAEADKDVTEAVRLLREERAAEMQQQIDDVFTLPANLKDQALIQENERDRLDFIQEYNLETERLVQNLEKELTKEEESTKKREKSVSQSKDRAQAEKQISDQLKNQIRTLDDASKLAAFIRGLQERRLRDSRNATREQVRLENNLFKAIRKRAQLEAMGVDTQAAEDRIRMLQARVDLAQSEAQAAAANAGLQVDDSIKTRFEIDLKQAEADAQAILNKSKAATNALQLFMQGIESLTSSFSSAPGDWVNALITGWEMNAPRFIEALLRTFQAPNILGANVPIPSFPGNIPVNGGTTVNPAQVAGGFQDNRNITFNVNGVQNPDEIAAIVRDRLFTNPPRARGFV